MFAIPPQITIPVGHLATVWNIIRNISPPLARSPRRSGHHATATVTEDDSTNSTNSTQEVTAGMRETLRELGLLDLPSDLNLDCLSPLMHQDIATRVMDDWHKSLLSSDSFYTNKHGHAKQDLLGQSSSHLRTSLPVLSPTQNVALTTRWLPQSYMQQTRGFKTKRVRAETGPSASIKKDQEENLGFFKIGRMKASAPRGEMASTVLPSGGENLTPEMYEKTKVAFAEGYLLGTQHEAQPVTKLRRSMKGLLLLGPIVILSYITYQLYQNLSRYGKTFVLGDVVDVTQGDDVEETFNDIKGADEVKEELMDIVEFLKNPDKFTALGATLPKGVLLCGPPGCGKTLLARAVAGEADVPFFYAAGAEFDEMFVGVGAKKIRDLFNEAKQRAPCVIFLDEIDAVGSKRSSSELHPYANQTINQLLTEMDGFKQNEGVIILGATNRREYLDQALLRPGRFDVEIHVQIPDFNGRKEIIELYLSKKKAADDIDVDRLARMTSGYTGADIANLVNLAAMEAGLRESDFVDMTHLEHAREKIIMGPMKKVRIPDEETNKVTAYHEAGHTLVAYFTKGATPPHKVTIMPRGQSLGHTAFIPEKDAYNLTKKQLLAEMDVAMGGRVAEEIIFGSDEVTTGASSDFQKANSIANNMVKHSGMSEKAGFRVVDDMKTYGGSNLEYSSTTMDLVDTEIRRLLQESYDRCKAILRNHPKELKDLAQALLEFETLERDEIKTILDGKRFVRKAVKSNGSRTRTVIPSGAGKKAIKGIIDGAKLQSPSNPSGNTVKKDSSSEPKTTDS